jgi:hypothetical protein
MQFKNLFAAVLAYTAVGIASPVPVGEPTVGGDIDTIE